MVEADEKSQAFMFAYVKCCPSKILSKIQSQREISWIFRPWHPHLNKNANYCYDYVEDKRVFVIYAFWWIEEFINPPCGPSPPLCLQCDSTLYSSYQAAAPFLASFPGVPQIPPAHGAVLCFLLTPGICSSIHFARHTFQFLHCCHKQIMINLVA